MIKLSVKKPFTVLVAVIAILMLAAVSLTQMTTNLLPEISTPYLMVITTYPGASPEKVELEVTKPLEDVLSTVNDVKNINSTSAENYSMVTMEFLEDTNMDSALVKVNTQIDTVEPYLPERAGTPTIMEISLDMLATMYVAVDRDDMDIYELTEYVDDEVVPYIQRQEGVASVTAIGLVEKNVEISLNEEKIDKLNDKLAGYVSDELDDAQEKLDDAQAEIDKGKSELNKGEADLKREQEEKTNELAKYTKQMNEALATQSAYNAVLTSLKADQTALNAEKNAYKEAKVEELYNQSNSLFTTTIPNTILPQLTSTKNQLTTVVNAVSALGGIDQIDTVIAGINMAIAANIYPPQMAAMGITDATTAAAKVTELQTLKASYPQAKATLDSISSIPTDAASYPANVAEAVSNATKLDNAIKLMKAMNTLATANGGTAVVTDEMLNNLTADNLDKLKKAVDRLPQIETELANLTTEIMANQMAVDQVNGAVSEAIGKYEELEAGKITAAAAFGSGAAAIASGRTALEDAQKQLDEAVDTYKESRDEALKAANLDTLLTLDTLSQLLSAQNFNMPAGYIHDGDDNKWLVKVGTEIEEVEEFENMVIADVDGIGEIKLTDVADITVTDNADDSYARMGHKPAVLLAIYKASTAGTSTVSKTCNNALDELEAETEGLHVTALMDQGEYIAFFINSVVSNMVMGAFFAVLVLILFFRSVKPTLVVAFSIPFSVLLAVLIMYFTDISINIMSLSGLSLGIGMLVDNSIVVIENIYRLRSKHLEAPRAAVQGVRQVAGAIISSTLTTICVFLPMVFTTGMVRQLMVPFALTITFALCASLVVALSVAPAMGSVLLRKSEPKRSNQAVRIQNAYGSLLDWCLRHKLIPLLIAGGLLALAVVWVLSMGYVLMPDMSSRQVLVSVDMDEDMTMEECYARADEITDTILAVDGVEQVGVMTNLESAFVGVMGGSENNYHEYSVYLVLDEDIDKLNELSKVQEDVEAALADEERCEVTVEQSGAGDMSALMSSGLSLNIYGDDTDKLIEISEDVMEIAEKNGGFENISNGQEEGDEVIHVIVDKNKAMAAGFPVAQIYSEIAKKLTTDSDATTITTDGDSLNVVLIDETHPLTEDNLMSMKFEQKKTGVDGETETKTYRLSDFARVEREKGVAQVQRENGTHLISVTGDTMEGYNTTRQSEALMERLSSYDLPAGYTIELGGEAEQVRDMVVQMMKLMALGLVLVYLVMVAQFQSLLSPFIILFTVPLAFTGGLFGLVIFGEQISIVSMMGFLVLMGTVVNNGIVFVDYTNQLRIAGMEKREALVATGKTRMRPILMTALTTILAMSSLVLSRDISAGMSKGMAVVVAAGLLYATLMTLFIVPIMYDIFFRGEPHNIDVGEDLDDVPDEISEFVS